MNAETSHWHKPGALLLLSALVEPSAAQSIRVFPSPDRALRVTVKTGATGESRVSIEDHSGHIVFVRDDTSADGSHGYGVEHAAWTADSRYFVVGTQPTGGHQPWSHAICVYSRSTNRAVDLGKFGVMVTGDFTLTPPNTIAITGAECVAGGKIDPQRTLTFSLRVLEADRKPDSICRAIIRGHGAGAR